MTWRHAACHCCQQDEICGCCVDTGGSTFNCFDLTEEECAAIGGFRRRSGFGGLGACLLCDVIQEEELCDLSVACETCTNSPEDIPVAMNFSFALQQTGVESEPPPNWPGVGMADRVMCWKKIRAFWIEMLGGLVAPQQLLPIPAPQPFPLPSICRYGAIVEAFDQTPAIPECAPFNDPIGSRATVGIQFDLNPCGGCGAISASVKFAPPNILSGAINIAIITTFGDCNCPVFPAGDCNQDLSDEDGCYPSEDLTTEPEARIECPHIEF
ncbi:MAG: hypothetical protein MI923_16235 [Phycisphaerales bacterium]|nr:hypothetical protein [Phycisphaerales bacterium]